MERKRLRQIEVERQFRQKGYRRKGIRVRLDKKRTARSRIKRKKASQRIDRLIRALERVSLPQRRFALSPYRDRHAPANPTPSCLCIMDTSGSMDTMKKYLARSFFFLLYHFICTRYQNVEIVFICAPHRGQEVTEEEFFHKGESGGTFISSGYNKALEIIDAALSSGAVERLCFPLLRRRQFRVGQCSGVEGRQANWRRSANLFGYGEIKPLGSGYYGSSMISFFRRSTSRISRPCKFKGRKIFGHPSRLFCAKDRAREDAA